MIHPANVGPEEVLRFGWGNKENDTFHNGIKNVFKHKTLCQRAERSCLTTDQKLNLSVPLGCSSGGGLLFMIKYILHLNVLLQTYKNCNLVLKQNVNLYFSHLGF